MQISLEWLKDYIKIDADEQKLTDLLTFSGIEVENVIHYGDLSASIITAKIIEVEIIKDSDHLMVCQVDTGSEIVQVVCGAPNCRKDMVGVLALPGTIIADFTIRKTKIRGMESSGMLCSEKELGLSDDHSGIIVLPSETLIGFSVKELFKLPDTLFELEITPNRPDLLGYLGVATDLAASLDENVIEPSIENINELEAAGFPVEESLTLKNLEPELCPRYVARVIKNVTISESPNWLKLRLIKSGMRPINNIVDITNYVMLETGHPLHAFDYDKLQTEEGKSIIKVRRAADQEEFPALDGKTYILDSHNLVIADAEKPIALAGVIGGMNSHITETTGNLVLEAACFNHSSIRRTAYKHKLSTDSSYRFERHLAPETAEFASC
ncbi:MAG: phenylalanine--tRNA ligase subunit beta, partial [Candidatus Cloacimonadaceae bacterium]